MSKLKQPGTHFADVRTVGGAWRYPESGLRPDGQIDVPYENSARTVLREMGIVLVGAFGFAFAVNVAFLALHVG